MIVLAVAYVGRFVSPRAAAVTGVAVALYPPLIANDTVALTESLSLLLLLAVLLALDAKRPVWCGVCMGLLLLARPNAYVIVVIVVVFLVWTVGWRRTGWFVVATLLCIAPWMVRNQIQIGSPRLTTSEGFNLAAIYSPRAQERGEFVDPAYDDAYRDDIALKLTQFDEAAWNAHLTEMGIEGLRENPGYLRYLVGENLRSYFELEPSNNDWAEEVDGRNLDFRNATLPLFYMVTIGGLVGFALNLRRRRLWPALLVTAQFIVLSVLLIAVPRLRSPFDLFMCIGLGLLVQWVIDRRIRRATSAPPDRSVGSESSPSIAASEHR